MLTRFGFDLLSAVVLAVTAALGAYAPVFLSQRDKLRGGSGRSFAYVIGNMFSAGVMVSAGFCHLLGEALKQMPHFQFPLAPFLCGCGYLLTLCADRAATLVAGADAAIDDGVEVIAGLDLAERGTPSYTRRQAAKEGENGPLLRSNSGSFSMGGLSGGGAAAGAVKAAANPRLSRSSSSGAEVGGDGGGSAAAANSGRTAPGAAAALPRLAASHSVRSNRLSGSFELELVQAADDSGVALQPPPAALHAAPFPSGSTNGTRHAGCHSQQAPSQGMKQVSFLTAVLMGVALCFHSLLEGAAMGAQSTISNSLHIFIAIVSHKGLAAYALGSSIVDSNADMNRFWSVILPFTFASPIGIFIGYVISDIAQGVGAASISALASGTFLYVAFMEVIPREMHDTRRTGAKLAALLLGFTLMSILAIWA